MTEPSSPVNKCHNLSLVTLRNLELQCHAFNLILLLLHCITVIIIFYIATSGLHIIATIYSLSPVL